jgi:deoxyribodipyrimidine photo-lyase
MTQMSFLEGRQKEPVVWEPTRADATARLASFLPKAGQTYARQRNFDFGPEDRGNVSALSPWIRHRLLLEEDVLRATLAKHSFSAAEKFIQEVFWRGYFKGWLEHRPDVWRRYRIAVRDLVGQMERDANLAGRYEAATQGRTGIACFDSWAKELVQTGYLHNHARMWFASIWIFTLKLPWELGADFFYRHLLDGDPASNTCSWRWVGGLHTKGKTYLARADNIERYTEGRFCPSGQLAADAPPLEASELPALVMPNMTRPEFSGAHFGLLITEEDSSPQTLPLPSAPKAVLGLRAPSARSVLQTGEVAKYFGGHAVEDATRFATSHFECASMLSSEDAWSGLIKDWAKEHALDALVTARLPIGPVSRRLKKAIAPLGIPLIEVTRHYDECVWPYTQRGFFGLKKKLTKILGELGLA